MNRALSLCFSLLLTMGLATAVAAKSPQPEIMGIRLGMTKNDAHARLKQLGNLEKEDRKRQEVWVVNDPRVSHLLVGFDRELRVRYVTAIARLGGKQIRYDDVADPESAQRTNTQGNYKLTWEVSPPRGQLGYVMMAHGHSPDYLETYSVKRVE